MELIKQIAIDTNIGIQILNGDEQLATKVRNFEMVYLPIVVCGKLLFGAKNSNKPLSNQIRYCEFMESAIILNINYLVAEEYAHIRKQLKDKGKPIPENDIWIAAICLSNQLPLATKDKHFRYIEGLIILDDLFITE